MSTHSLEHMVEAATIRILCENVPGVTWLHYEHETTDNDGQPVGIVKMERGIPVTECYHRADLVIHVVGACDEIHRQIDEAVGSRDDLAADLVSQDEEIAIREVSGWSVIRAIDNANKYSRTWTNEVEVAYQKTN